MMCMQCTSLSSWVDLASKAYWQRKKLCTAPQGPLGPQGAPMGAPWVGSCVPGQTLELGKPGIGHFEKTWIGIFSKYFENRGMFSNYSEKIPPPPGAAAPGVFSKWPQFQVFQVSGFGRGRKTPPKVPPGGPRGPLGPLGPLLGQPLLVRVV